MRKIISILLTFILLIGVYVLPNSVVQASSKSLYFEKTFEGYVLSEKSASSIKGKFSDWEEILVLSDGTYITKVNNDVYSIVERFSIDISDNESINLILSNGDLETEVKDDLIEMIETFEVKNGIDKNVDIFYIPTPRTRVTTTTYESYKGYSVKHVNVWTYRNTNYQPVVSGSSTKQVAGGMYSLATIGASTNPQIALVSTGVDILEAFVQAASVSEGQIVGYSGDSITVKYQYEHNKKYTYIQDNGIWSNYCNTYSVKMKKVTTHAVFRVNNTVDEENEEFVEPNMTIHGPYYSSPAERAYFHMTHYSYKFGNYTFRFEFADGKHIIYIN
jgi:hypothetical protein